MDLERCIRAAMRAGSEPTRLPMIPLPWRKNTQPYLYEMPETSGDGDKGNKTGPLDLPQRTEPENVPPGLRPRGHAKRISKRALLRW
ncbi:hypothetical protein ACKI2N_010855 [Cupriavidus sp. 30B13]|uniref:hypothetical protein n=1 Tax=Cupriavidus sp. 30B13 TaxID=3384241 RepID=UPI003B8FE977